MKSDNCLINSTSKSSNHEKNKPTIWESIGFCCLSESYLCHSQTGLTLTPHSVHLLFYEQSSFSQKPSSDTNAVTFLCERKQQVLCDGACGPSRCSLLYKPQTACMSNSVWCVCYCTLWQYKSKYLLLTIHWYIIINNN